ncbi:MAG: hypothetical protein HYZ54_04360, partial [Ignavibacteriae bacterium]|nr:hypothetical protein [Ignavibacteriota bacterium]
MSRVRIPFPAHRETIRVSADVAQMVVERRAHVAWTLGFRPEVLNLELCGHDR